jgi:cation diffusion facilitator CzcD-associated flavoprotein CzcO
VLPKEDRHYSAEEREHFLRDPAALREFRDLLVDRVNRGMTFRDPEVLRQNEERGLAHLEVVVDPDLRAKLTPKFPWGARRPILSNKYFPTFNRDDVTLITDPIESITPNGIRTADGVEHAVDVIIFATGFATTKYLSVLDVTGRDGLRLEDAWADDPMAFLGVMTSGFPNLFMLYGPNTNNGSIITMLEHAADFVVRQVTLLDEAGLAWIDVKREVMEVFNVELQAELDKTEAWQADKEGYYRGRSGRIVTQWPSTMSDYDARLRAVGIDSFDHAILTRSARNAEHRPSL